MRFETIRQWIYEVGYKIKDYGYRVFVTESNGFCYLHFTDGRRVGYVQLDLGGFSVSARTAPGLSVARELDDVTKDVCELALTCGIPSWHGGRIIFFDEFAKKNLNKEGTNEI